jgi:uncharacterized protein (TIGR02302 family)
MSENPQRVLKFKVFQARLGLIWEQLWQALFWPVMIVGLTLLAVFSGFLVMLPYGIRLVVLAITGLVFLYSLRRLFLLHWPDEAAALGRVEQRSDVSHRPVTAWFDELAGGDGDEQTKALWQAHKKRQHEQFSNLKAGVPRSNWMYLDHGGWRFTLALLLLVSVVLSGGDWRRQIARVASSQTIAAKPVDVALDAWISPPAFTRKAPVLLTSVAKKAAIARGEAIVVPEGSILKVRVNGVREISIVVSQQTGAGTAGDVLETLIAKAGANDDDVVEKRLKLQRPVFISVQYDGKSQADWKISLIPDASPMVEVVGDISTTPTGGFSVPWRASDDYGIASLKGVLSLAKQPDLKNDGKKGQPLKYDPPKFQISMSRINPKKAKGRAFQDLTAHPWAGQKVHLVLVAKDQAGQMGKSKVLKFVLPQRRFSKPLARALVEQRRRLVENPNNKKGIIRVLVALMAWPQGVIKKSGNYLGLRIVTRQLYRAQSDQQLKATVAEIWKLALQIEEADLSATRKALEEARRALQKALAQGASKEKIAELTAKLKKALDSYMAAMERQMQKALANQQNSPNGLQQQRGKEIRARDLQKMMDNIENLAKSGANDAAQEMLSQLENILKNLNPNQARQEMAPQRTPPEAKMLEELTRMMRKQRELMDKTFKMKDQKPGRKKSGQRQKNGRGDKKQGNKLGNKLGDQQQKLKNLLGKMMQQMQDGGMKMPRSLKQARRAMEKASKALKDGEKGSALGMQGNAMQGLRKGAETMANDLRQRGKGEEGNFGEHGESNANRNDPLGRPRPRDSADLGPEENILPKEREIMRAQDIMRSLRQRSNDRQRPKYELQYLERLLDGLF